METKDNLGIEELQKASNAKRRLNVKLLFKLFLFIFFLFYFYSLFYGESSIGVLQKAYEREQKLKDEYHTIQNENQKLQKKHFELIQLTPEEDEEENENDEVKESE